MCQTDQNCSTRRHEGGGMVLVSLRGSSLSRAVVLPPLGRAAAGARHS